MAVVAVRRADSTVVAVGTLTYGSCCCKKG